VSPTPPPCAPPTHRSRTGVAAPGVPARRPRALDAATPGCAREGEPHVRPLANRLERIWSTGAAGQPPQTARQITLSNQAALFAFASTVPYQIYYLATDPAYYLPLLLSNLAFMAVHASVLPL